MNSRRLLPLAGCLVLSSTLVVTIAAVQTRKDAIPKLGKQGDGSFVVASGQTIGAGTIAFDGRPVDLALSPDGKRVAVLGQNRVFLIDTMTKTVVAKSQVDLGAGAGFHGIAFSPDGGKIYASVSSGIVQEIDRADDALTLSRKLDPKAPGSKKNPRPGGLCVTRDGQSLFVACLDRNQIVEFDLGTGKETRAFPTQNLPFDVKLSPDEAILIASNWAGRPARADETEDEDETAESDGVFVVIDPRGVASSGSVSLATRATGAVKQVEVGTHPTGIAVSGDRAFVCDAASDSVSVVDWRAGKTVARWPLKFGDQAKFGAMPVDAVVAGDRLLVACGGDNAIAELDLESGKVLGYRPAGFYPMALATSANGSQIFALNTKGNGSVRNTIQGKPGNAHDFQGTVSVIERGEPLAETTRRVANLNGWNRDRRALRPNQAVFNGAIKHVLYIVKENRTYDEVFGDIPGANGDPALCKLGEEVTPNHHKLAREFTLFDNGYVSGTNSADGHQWTEEALANDYLEHFYTGYRTYPDDGDDPMSAPSSGYIWDAALAKKKSVRVYGEFCDDAKAAFSPRRPKDWLEMYRDRGKGFFSTKATTDIPTLKKLIHPNVLYWPLLQSDQVRADLFIDEFSRFSRADKVPSLMILTLPTDHTEGLSEQYPKPRSMVADNDLALGRVVEAISKSPQWKNFAIFVIEDDAQAGPDHVDGHRTVYMCFSPYTRRGFVDSNLYTTVSMLRTIELMLGLDPMNRFDANTPPLSACFTEKPDLRPYASVPNRVPLDDMNVPRASLSPGMRKWYDASAKLDWSGIDRADFETLNRVLWHHLHGEKTPYPTRSRPRASAEAAR